MLAFSQEAHSTLYNTQTQKTIFLKPGHENCTAKSGAVDPQGQYIATSGSDGFLNIYKFTQDQENVEFLEKVKMTNKRVPQDSTFDLKFQWLDDGETILIPGNTHIVFVQKDDDSEKWNKIEEERINHKTEITSIMSISNEILLTYSQQDQTMKIWKLDEEGCTCQQEIKLKNKAT